MITIASTIINSGMDPPGIPATPMAVTTDMSTTISCAPRERCTPKTCARKSTVAPSKSAVPFMFIVAPRGSTNPATSRGMASSSWATRSVVGSVALLDDVEKAVSMTTLAFLKNSSGLNRATSFSMIG